MIKLLVFGSFIAWMVCSTPGCRSREEPQKYSDVHQILGENDLVPVINNGQDLPAVFSPLINAIGRMDAKCTVTHIGQGFVITAGHCIDSSNTEMGGRKKNVPCNFNVEWGLRKDAAPFLVSKCTKVLAFKFSLLAEDWSSPDLVDTRLSDF